MPNIVAGSLFVLLGLIFIIKRGTGFVNGLQMFGLRTFFYDWQNFFFENIKLFNIIGIVVFLIFVSVLVYFLVKEIRNNRTE
jgi:uncharacterized membrane protein